MDARSADPRMASDFHTHSDGNSGHRPGDAADTHRPCPSEVRVRSLQRVFEQSNFTCASCVSTEAPAIEVHAAASSEAPGGIGKPGTVLPGAGSDQCDLRGRGKRERNLPVDPDQLKAV